MVAITTRVSGGAPKGSALTNAEIDANFINLNAGLAAALHKLDATVAPGVSDDGVAGYSIGSNWINLTSNIAYVCVDVSTGAAVWSAGQSAAQVTAEASSKAIAMALALG